MNGLLIRLPNDRDGQLVLARAHLRMRDLAAAKADLAKLGPASKLPGEYQPMVEGLTLLVDGSLAKSPEDWTKLVDGFVKYSTLDKTAGVPANLTLNSYEQEQSAVLRTVDGQS